MSCTTTIYLVLYECYYMQSRHYVCLTSIFCFFFFNDTATTEIYTLSLHDALPIFTQILLLGVARLLVRGAKHFQQEAGRSEEHTSELQSRQYLVCRLLLEKKKK